MKMMKTITKIDMSRHSTSSRMTKVKCPIEGCHVKIRLVDFACKCEKVFCVKHRLPEVHACTFDYKASAKEVLLKYMSTPIVAAKMEAI